MSKYHDDTTRASNPGRIRLSIAKLRQLHPQPDARYPDDLIAEHLALGDSRAAVVVSVAPLLVAAYTDELDCVVLLSFPPGLVAQHRLTTGTRLLTVNTYKRGMSVARDLTPGPKAYPRWVDFWPTIAEFLSDDREVIEGRKATIAEEEWTRALAMGREALAKHPGRARDGRPYFTMGGVAGALGHVLLVAFVVAVVTILLLTRR